MITKTEYKLLTEVLESYIQTNESGMIDEIYYTKSDKVYSLVNKLKKFINGNMKILKV